MSETPDIYTNKKKEELPEDYKEILQMSETPDIYTNKKEEELPDILIKGVLLQEGKLWLALNNNGEKNETISAKLFSYENRKTYKRRYIQKSRFKTVVKMLDISNLNIQIKIKTQFLSPNVIYGAYLVFKFCDPPRISSQLRYVNLKYKMEGKSLHAYFATRTDDEWMMIELCRFLNYKKDIDFEVLIESLSRYYCGNSAIYVEGIEFRVIDNVKPEEIERIKEVHQVLDQEQQSPASFLDVKYKSENEENTKKVPTIIQNIFVYLRRLTYEVNVKKHLMLPAKEILYNYPNETVYRLKATGESRFQEVIEILPQQVFGINSKIQRNLLSRDTKYMCYLVFKISEKCHGLHCPVKVRNLLDPKKKETRIIYFRSPSPSNVHKIIRVPKQREDGRMEVNVWEFNSNEVKNDLVHVNLKLISYEGTMYGLMVCGLEFRPI
ncbi:uncharacterized protein [Rutidosis leptorrhynchoides]|uniref:uncharacterized protein n=1 Tax=Rutidosis leptorrhynchoides TaxID=125765 RepID=UPI003A98E92D